MSEDIASLAIKVDSTDTDKANRSLRELEQQGSKTEKSTLALTSAFKSLGIAIGAASFANFIRSGINALDTLNDLSLKTGIAANKLAGMKLAAEQSGTSIDSFAHALNLLSVNMANNSQAFAKLGVSAKEPLQAFYQLVGVMEAIDDPQTRAAVGAQALGRGWQELAPLLANGVNGLKQAVEQGERLSGVTVQATKDADAFNDQLAEMTTWLGSVAIKLAGPIVDGFNQLSAHIREATNDGLTFMNVMRGIADFAAGSATLSGYAKQLKDTNDLIADQEKKVEAIKNASSITGKIYEVAGIDIKKEKQSLDNLYRQQEELYLKVKKATEPQKGESANAPDTKAIKDFIGVKETQTKAVKEHSGAVRQAVSEETKAYNQLQSAYEGLDESLRKQLALSRLSTEESTNASLEYDLIEGSLSDLSEEKKKYLLLMAQEINHNEITKKENEAQSAQLEQLTDKYNQLTLSARDYFKTQLESQGIKGDAQAPILAQYDKNTRAEAQKKALDDSRAAFDQLVSSADTANEHMKGLAATTTSVFDASLGGANQLIGAFDSMIGSIKQSNESLKDLNKTKAILDAFRPQNKDDEIKLADQKKKLAVDYQQLQKQTFDDYLAGTRQMAGAMAAMSSDNEDAQKAAQAVALVTLGIQAVQAIVSQGQGDPYTAFARMAAMAAIVGQMVSSVGGSSPGSVSGSAPKGSASTGTVLGDNSSESNSISNVVDTLKSIHADEYVELRGINKGVVGLSAAITGTVTKLFQAGGLDMAVQTMQPKISGQGVFGLKMDPIANFLSAGLFGKTTEKLVGRGISTDAFQAGGQVQGNEYATIERTKKSWFSTKTSYRTQTGALDDATEEALTNIFKSMGQTMQSVAGNLSKVIGKDIAHRVTEYIIPAMKIELNGLNGEEAAKKVNAVISTALDEMSSAVFGDIIAQYQQLGEGMLETAVRIVSEVAVVKDALSQSGLAMADDAIALSDSLVQAAGGLEEFQKQFNSFYDAFFTDMEKQTRLQERLTQTLKEAYVILPPTREAYRKMTESLDLNNQLDKERYSLMLQLASAADQYYSAIESGATGTKDLSKEYAQQEIQIMKLTGDAAGALAKERQLEIDAMDESLRAIQRLIYSVQDLSTELEQSYNNAAGMLTATFTTFFDLAKSLVKYRDGLKAGPLSTGSPESKYQDSRKAFDSIQAAIKAGPGKTDASEAKYRQALGNLEGAAQSLLENSKQYNASGKGYGKDFADVEKALTSGAKASLGIASDAEKQLNAMNDMVSGVMELNLSIIGLGGQIEKVSSAVWEASKVRNAQAWLQTSAITEENKLALSQKGVLNELGKDGVLKALSMPGVINALGQKGVLGALESKTGIKGLLDKGGPIAEALGQKGVLGVFGENKPLLKALSLPGVIKALGTEGVLGELKGGLKNALTGNTGSVGSAVKQVKGAIDGTNGLAGAINSVSDAIGKLNGTEGIKGAVASVNSGIAGLTKAMIEMVESAKERDRITAAAAKATKDAQDKYLKEQAALTAKGKEETRIAENQKQYNRIQDRINPEAIYALLQGSGQNVGLTNNTSNWAKGLLGSFDKNDSMDTLVKMAYLMEDFRRFVASGQPTYNGHDGSWFASEFTKLKNKETSASHANGLEYVPYDGYKATLHQGERVQTRFNASEDDKETKRIFNEILLELKAANRQRGAVAVELIKKADESKKSADAQTRAIRQGQVTS